MAEPIEKLEERIDALRVEVRRAASTGDQARVRALRAELRDAEHAWEDALAEIEEQAAATQDSSASQRAGRQSGVAAGRQSGAGPLLPIREQVHQALTLLGVPAAPRLIVAVHEAFFAGEILNVRLTSLRRDEERSFTSAPFARPYYICSALAADRLAAVRGLLAVSTWPMDRRMVGPLSPRVHFLSAAIAVAEQMRRVPDTSGGAARLLWRFAANIPGAADGLATMKPAAVLRAARAELAVHEETDRTQREAAARRARRQLSDVDQLFGARFGPVPGSGTGGRSASAGG